MKNKTETFISCEYPLSVQKSKKENKTRLYRYRGDFRWRGIKVERYKTYGERDWSEVIRQVIIGSHGESTRFHLRYFEISPKGYTSFERHKHEHVVVVIRGRGKVRVNNRTIEIGYLDTIYISPDTPHRLYNPYEEPFGFFCIVNARRDRPKPVKISSRKRG